MPWFSYSYDFPGRSFPDSCLHRFSQDKQCPSLSLSSSGNTVCLGTAIFPVFHPPAVQPRAFWRGLALQEETTPFRRFWNLEGCLVLGLCGVEHSWETEAGSQLVACASPLHPSAASRARLRSGVGLRREARPFRVGLRVSPPSLTTDLPNPQTGDLRSRRNSYLGFVPLCVVGPFCSFCR